MKKRGNEKWNLIVFSEIWQLLLYLSKVFGIIARKCKAPQVVGEIIGRSVDRTSVLGLVQQSDFLIQMAEIGVILLMFSAGLETNLKDLMKTGFVAFLIACMGVFVPLVGGTLLYMGFYGVAPWGSEKFYEAVFIGVIMTATSVSITVQSLKELGKLKGKVGTTIMSAAIIDDVIGIIVLTFVIGFKNPDSNPGSVVISTLLFFLFAIGVGFVLFKVFQYLDNKYPHTRRIPILGLALCFIFAYVAEVFFGIADITVLTWQVLSCAPFGIQNTLREDGYQFLYDLRSYLFRKYWIKDQF